MNSMFDVSPSVCAFMSLSMLADQPNLPDTRTQGEELSRFEIWTLATLSPSCCFIQSHRRVYSCLLSFSLSSSSSPNSRSSLLISTNFFSLYVCRF
uniref:Uncharacterized protein n=1 Tax=Arundo donax TaxID=35708 RepID=A0A0A9EBZ0_ARUDO